MNIRSERDFLKVQLIEMQRFKEMAEDHPLMSLQFAQRVQELREKLAGLPDEPTADAVPPANQIPAPEPYTRDATS
jgi:hypothetical protein